MELPGHGQLQNTRFNVGSFMCAAAGSGDRDRLEWVITLPNGTSTNETRPLIPAMFIYSLGTDQLEYRNGSGRVSYVLWFVFAVCISRVHSQTPLLIAASKGHKECVALLLENGADLQATVKLYGENVTALKLAERGGHTETMGYIRKCQGNILHWLFQF